MKQGEKIFKKKNKKSITQNKIKLSLNGFHGHKASSVSLWGGPNPKEQYVETSYAERDEATKMVGYK